MSHLLRNYVNLFSLLLSITYAHHLSALNASELIELDQAGHRALAQNDLLTACRIFKIIATVLSNNENILNTTAYLLSRTNENQQAIEYYKAALQKNPSLGGTQLGLAKAQLATGNFKEGWHNFEWRLGEMELYQKAFGYLNVKPDHLKGKRVLIRAEWGLGDMIQFMRYAKLLKQAGATVTLQAFDPLVNLFSRCDFLDHIISTGEAIPSADLQIPLLSLPLIFDTELETIPADIPYIFADPVLIDYWHNQLKSDTNLKIGICWHAKPIYIEDHMFTRRSIPLETFIPLTSESVSFYSLQKEFGTDEIEKISSSSLTVHTFDDDFDVKHGRFADTAAVIMNLDLVISADTSIVHVAGALGKQVWVLLPYAAEWRWLPSHPNYAHSPSTPWYPNMRLFKQKTPGNWTTVIEEVQSALAEVLKNR